MITSFTILLNCAVSTLSLSNYFYPSISTHQNLWPNRQGKQLLTTGSKAVRDRFHGCGTLANSKPVRGRFHGFGTLTSKEALNRTYQYTSFVECCDSSNSGAGTLFRWSALSPANFEVELPAPGKP